MGYQHFNIIFTLIGIYFVKSFNTQTSFGTGSSRLEESVASEFNKIVDDTVHIKDDFEHLFTQSELDEMEHDRVAFTWYTAHNNNEDDGLDGLELLKAIIHAHSHKNDLKADGASPEGSEDNEFSDEIELVDALLTTFDENENGLLEYSEFMKAFQETREQLGM